MRNNLVSLITLVLMACSSFCHAQKLSDDVSVETAAQAQSEEAVVYGNKAVALDAFQELDQLSNGIQQLKKEVISLNRDLRDLEDQLLFPSSTKYSFFVTLNDGKFFTLESVKLKLDGELVTSHLYSEKARQALSRGGTQKIYNTNLSEGKHTLVAFFTGLGPNNTPFKRATEVVFEKGAGEGYMEIAIIDDADIQEPRFQLKQW